MTDGIQAFLQEIVQYNRETEGSIAVREAEPLSRHTTFRIGGAADLYIEPTDETGLQFLLHTASQMQVRTFVIGRGSNLLFADAGFRGAVISTAALRTVSVEKTILCAGAGATLAACANAAADAGLTGLEFAHGIPGSVGGAVFMNAGAYDGEIAQVLVRSRYYDSVENSFGELDAAAHLFGYRESVYRHTPHRVIVSAEFCLTPGDPDEIRARMADLMRRRAEKQPLSYPSAGSAFKRYPGRYTAQMIDGAGLKGAFVGGAQVSEKHAGFIINRGGATAADVQALIEQIQKAVRTQYGVCIEPEIVCVPEM